MIGFIFFIFAAVQFYLNYRLFMVMDSHGKRLTALEQNRPKSVVSAPQPKQIWEKEIEGFNPKKPATVLPRSEEEKKARVYTNWEIDSDFKIVG
jgi:hypothetical protein